jgi:hypothetical protein
VAQPSSAYEPRDPRRPSCAGSCGTISRPSARTLPRCGTARGSRDLSSKNSATWGGGLWFYQPYKDNTQSFTIWNANGDAAYAAGQQGSDDWHFGSERGGQVRKKFWPVLDAPTNLTFGNVTATSVQFSWTSTTGDGDGFDIWRSTDGVNFVDYAVSSTASYTDTGVTSGQQYFYYVRARLSGGNGNAGPTGPVTGPASATISTTTP